MKIYYMLNAELNGIEIYFEDKPGEVIRDELKANRFRWNKKKSCWYAKQTEAALDLAERLTSGRAATAEQIRTEIRQKHEANKLTIEKMQEAAKSYTFEETGEGLYSGWTGCNCQGVNLHGQELKKAILAELKKNGIKATAKSGRGYTDSFTFTITVPKEFSLDLDAFIKEQSEGMRPFWWMDKTNGKEIHDSEIWNLPGEERERIEREHWTAVYNRETADGKAIPTEEFKSFCKAIISSFNSDHSNGQVDYFDRGFYDWYTWKAA